MTEHDVESDQPVAWRAVPEDTPVRSSDGQTVGTLYDLLGSHEEDIFHGMVVQLAGERRRVFVGADDVDLLTAGHVDVELTAKEIHTLPDHADERIFDARITGTFRKHLGWVREKDR